MVQLPRCPALASLCSVEQARVLALPLGSRVASGALFNPDGSPPPPPWGDKDSSDLQGYERDTVPSAGP